MSLPVWKVSSLVSVMLVGHAPSEGSRGDLLSPLPASGALGNPQISGPVTSTLSASPPSSHSLLQGSFGLLLRIPVIGFRLDCNSIWSHLTLIAARQPYLQTGPQCEIPGGHERGVGWGFNTVQPPATANQNKLPPPKYKAKWREMTNYTTRELQSIWSYTLQ